jgi:hypothetical protein
VIVKANAPPYGFQSRCAGRTFTDTVHHLVTSVSPVSRVLMLFDRAHYVAAAIESGQVTVKVSPKLDVSGCVGV